LGVLTKVKLYVGKSGSPSSDLVVSVKSSITGADLTSVAKSSGSISSDLSWVEFDLPDISVTPGSTYYLVVRTSSGISSQNYLWGYGYYNPYLNGSFWMSTSSGSYWTEYAAYDFCFQTYGRGGGNSPPNVPTIPSGPVSRMVGESGTYSTSAVDPDGDQVQYRFDWNAGGSHEYSGWTSLVASGQSMSMSHSWSSAGTYLVRTQAKDEYGNEGSWSSGLTVTVTASNNPPNTPSVPTGPATRLVGESGTYSTSATDPDGDQIQYQFDWNAGGTHDYSGWASLVPSGQSVSMSHSWSSAGTYLVRAQARDEHGSVSDWSTGLTVTVTGGLEILDQESTRYDKANSIWSTRWSAQSFKPSWGVLTKVKLYVGKAGSPSSDLVVSVRSSLNGADLTSVAKSSGSIPSSLSWIDFDLPDIGVTPGSIYYLVVRTSGGTSTQNYVWGYGYYNPYPNGSFWMSTNSGSSWTQYASYDFCFKTYGI